MEAKTVMHNAQDVVQLHPLNASYASLEKKDVCDYARVTIHEESMLKKNPEFNGWS